jgi:hypothetical protein
MGKTKNATSLVPTGAPAEDIVVGEWLATKRDLLRVMVRDFKGHTLIDIRRWYRDVGGTSAHRVRAFRVDVGTSSRCGRPCAKLTGD